MLKENMLTGSDECRNKMTSVLATCPNTKFIVSGYSVSFHQWADFLPTFLRLPLRTDSIMKWNMLTYDNSKARNCAMASKLLPL